MGPLKFLTDTSPVINLPIMLNVKVVKFQVRCALSFIASIGPYLNSINSDSGQASTLGATPI